ncbi:hypothetical protein BH18ACT12_BH18ACT12_06870 [soil metagenome]
MSSKRQTTMAKLTRERKVQERRELKLEKRLARKAKANGELTEDAASSETDGALSEDATTSDDAAS